MENRTIITIRPYEDAKIFVILFMISIVFRTTSGSLEFWGHSATDWVIISQRIPHETLFLCSLGTNVGVIDILRVGLLPANLCWQ